MTKNIISISIVSLFVLTGCMKAPEVGGGEPLPVGGQFDFATTSDLPLTINYALEEYPVMFEIYDRNPMETTAETETKIEGLEPIFRAITDDKGYFSGIIHVATAATDLYLYTKYIGIPTVIPIAVVGGAVNFDMAATATAASATRSALTRAGVSGDLTMLGNWNKFGTPDYLISRVKLTGELMNNITYSLPESAHGIGATGDPNGLIVEGKAIGDLKIVKPTAMNLIFMHEGASMTSTLGYYCYPTDTPPATPEELKRIIAIPNVSYAYSGGELSSGDRVKLKYWNGTELVDEFPAGTTIGWFLIPSGFDSKTAIVNEKPTWIRYSNPLFNTTVGNKQHCVALRDQANKIVALGFEDQNRTLAIGDGDFNDAVFYVDTDTDGAIDTDDIPDIIPNPTPEPKPEDNYIVYQGSLAFEDLWPSKGDYDMNDMVIDYQSIHYRDKFNKVIRIEDRFVPKWSGATLNNGFGYQLGITGGRISNVHVDSDYDVDFRLFKTDGKGLELGQNKATVMLFENMNDVMAKSNVTSGEYKTFTVTIELTLPTTLDELTAPPYNPFLVAGSVKKDFTVGSRTREVHLPTKMPTDLADRALFSTGNDKSDVAEGRYYVSDENYSFALNLPVVFDFPAEKQGIDKAYGRYTSWVLSNGKTDTDWYLDVKK